jgi:hypothetical protein
VLRPPPASARGRGAETLRHTCASILLSREAPLLYVQAVDGWSSATVLLGSYARYMPAAGGLIPAPLARQGEVGSA